MPVGMTTPPRRATIDDVQDLSTTLATAFFDDPVFRWCMPDHARRREILPGFFRVMAEAYLPLGEVYTNDGAAAAVWVPPETHADDERLVRELEAVCAEYGPALFTLAALMAERHPHERHYYLFFMGTRPQWQSRGLGSGLMRAMLDVCDRDGVPAYLEASSERNKALYLRHGFEETGEIQLPAGPTMCCMWRR